MPGKHSCQSDFCDGEMGHTIHFHLLELLLELPQVKKMLMRTMSFLVVVVLSFGVTLRKTAVLLHSGCFLNV